MLKRTLKGIIPVFAILAVAACADATGPTSPELQAVAEADGGQSRKTDQGSPHETSRLRDQTGTQNR